MTGYDRPGVTANQ